MPKFLCLGVFAGAFLVSGSASASAFDPLDPSFSDGPPRGTYVWVDQEDVQAAPDTQEGLGAPHVLFLNRCQGGLTITTGQNDSVNNVSSIGGGTFPEYPYSNWAEVMSETRRIFAPYNITITDVDPSPATHDEAIVCGTPGVIGMPNGVGGVAPFSCGQITNAITFTFAAVYGGDVDQIVATIGQEAAHAWGLEHLLSCNDPMTYLSSPFSDEGQCWPKEFQDKDSQCGEGSPRSCDCGGTTQNSHQQIIDMFGSAVPDTAAPLAAITSPMDGEFFSAGDDFAITAEVSDDVALTEVRLYNNGGLQATSNTAPFGPWDAANIPEGTYDLYIEAEDAAGNVTTSDTVSITVNADGMPPGEDDTAGESDTTEPDDSASGSSGSGDPDDEQPADDEDEDDDGEFESDGALPGQFGAGNGNAEGCACTSDPRDGGPTWAMLFLGTLLGLRTRRRR